MADEDDVVVHGKYLNQPRTPIEKPAHRIRHLDRCSILTRDVVERALGDHAHHAFGVVRGAGHDGQITACGSYTVVLLVQSYYA